MKRIRPSEIKTSRKDPVDDQTLEQARAIVEDVRARGSVAVREHAERLGDITPGAPLIKKGTELSVAGDRALLERTAERITRFAQAQRASLAELSIKIDGGRAGHHFAPVEAAGCYAPGGRYPLPSSVLMTALTARAAGVEKVWVASPRPAPMTLLAASIAGADGVLCIGGAQAIAALAFGIDEIPRCDAIVGPGNRWVTAAKQLLSGRVAIDMLAGPSELVVLADSTGDAGVIASDLLAQAEHDPDALPVLVTTDRELADRVDAEVARQLATLSTRAIAEQSIAEGFIVIADDLDDAIAACDALAPEHLEVHLANASQVAPRLRHFGAIFIGSGAAEVLGDYGAGPNHVLPTSSASRFTGGLSVLNFLRMRTWLELDDLEAAQSMIDDAIALARHEGLEAHARSAERRKR